MSDTDPTTTVDLPTLLRRVGTGGRNIVYGELRALSDRRVGEAGVFVPAWRTIAGDRRVRIISVLIELAEDNLDLNFDQIFLWCLDDPDAAVRARAIDGLAEADSPMVMGRMLEALHADPEPGVREAAALGLARFARAAACGDMPASAADALAGALGAALDRADDALEVRRRALEALGYLADAAGVTGRIAAAYGTGEQLWCESALVAMGRSMAPQWLPVIRRELSHDSPARRYEAALAVGEHGEAATAFVGVLTRLAGEDDGEVALAAIWALAQIGGPAARRALGQIARSADDARRSAAEEALDEDELGAAALQPPRWRQTDREH
jgi:HEAT repeat protein